jgi:penicillin-binding protein 1A
VTTIDSRQQRTANWAVRAALLEYDRRHGWRGPVGHAARIPTDRRDAAAMLERFGVVGGLVPAVITTVGSASAAAIGKDGRAYTIPWDTGLSWARPVDRNAARPRSPADVAHVGDVVYLLPAAGGRALLAQIPLVQGSFVSLDPQDGAITALVGGFDYYTSKFNRVVQARRQPGSGFKPFIYSAALEHGFSPATVILDAPLVLNDGTDQLWRPENDSKEFYGPTRMRDALARSRNLVSIRILRAIGVDYAIDYASRFGFKPDELPHNLTLALGTAQVSPLQLTTGFAVFANGGFRVDPYLVERVLDVNGTALEIADPAVACAECDVPIVPPLDPATTTASGEVDTKIAADVRTATPEPPTAVWSAAAVGPNAPGVTRRTDLGDTPLLTPRKLAPRVISAANAFIMTDMMRDVIRRGTARRALSLKRDDIAGKTGTTNDRRDTWFTGFNADLVADAWVGFDQERSLGAGEEGGHTALPTWVYFMGDALAGKPPRRLPQPDGVVSARISPSTGELAKAGDPEAEFEFFLTGHLPGAGALVGDQAATRPVKPSNSNETSIF